MQNKTGANALRLVVLRDYLDSASFTSGIFRNMFQSFV